MPIRESEKSRYPKPAEWEQIRKRILARAKNRCEFCGVRQYGVGYWEKDGFRYIRGNRFWDQFEYTDCYADAREACDFENEWRDPDDPKRIVIVLTIAHLDHTPEHNADDNLKSLCQRCHLRYDAKHHQHNAAITRKSKNTVLTELFDFGDS